MWTWESIVRYAMKKKSTALKNKYEISLKGSELFCMNTFDYIGQTEIQTSKKKKRFIKNITLVMLYQKKTGFKNSSQS